MDFPTRSRGVAKRWCSEVWGICLDSTVCGGSLFYAVIEYERSDDGGTVDIIQPVKGVQVSAIDVKQMDHPPRFVYGEAVSPVNHPELTGVIRVIGWHFKNQDYMYLLTVDGRKKSKRYYSCDLLKR